MKASTLLACAVVAACAFAAVSLMVRPSPAQHIETEVARVLVDTKNNCRYLVGGTEDGLNIVITGAEHCRSRILVDGVRINPGQRVRL